MAVTILTEPQNYTPSGNPVVFTFESDQTAQANFSYLVEVYVNATLQGRQQIFPDNGIKARIDLTGYAERFTSAPVMSTAIATDAGNTAKVGITVIERFGDPIADGASVSSNQIAVFKAKLNDVDFIQWNPLPYILDNSTAPTGGVSFMNTFPVESDEYLCSDSEQIRLMIISDQNADRITIELFDSNDASIVSDNVATPAADILIVSVGAQNVIANTTITQANFDAATYYTVRAIDLGAPLSSNSYRITIDRNCNRDTSKRLHFISTRGTMESFTYGLYSNESGSVTTVGYEKEFGNWNGDEFEFNLNNGREIDYRKNLKKELLLRSNWLTEGVQNWLDSETAVSPFVFVEDADDPNLGLRRVGTLKSRFVPKTIKQDTQFREEIRLKLERFTSMSL